MVTFRNRPGYIFAAVVLATVGVVHRSRVVRWAGAVGIRGDGILADNMFVGWDSVIFWWYVFAFSRSFSDQLEFQVGLVVEAG